MNKKIAIINLGLGNIGSLINSIKRLNVNPKIVTTGEDLLAFNPTHIIMPGVGAVGQAMDALVNNHFIGPLNTLVEKKGCYFCGICLGMQVLLDSSEEFGNHKCLGWIAGKVEKLKSKELSLPHMGWNTMHVKKMNSPVFQNMDKKDMYFAHSFTIRCSEEYIECTTNYGNDFISAVRKNNIYGIQCHPEKSANIGSVFFKNFLDLGLNIV